MHVELIIASIAAVLPTVTVLVGILLGRNDYNKLDARLSSELSKLDARISSEIGRLDSRMTALENRFHSDIMQVIGKLTELESRVARLEEKVTR